MAQLKQHPLHWMYPRHRVYNPHLDPGIYERNTAKESKSNIIPTLTPQRNKPSLQPSRDPLRLTQRLLDRLVIPWIDSRREKDVLVLPALGRCTVARTVESAVQTATGGKGGERGVEVEGGVELGLILGLGFSSSSDAGFGSGSGFSSCDCMSAAVGSFGK